MDANSVWRVKGSDKLDRRGLAVLRELWHWREQEAIAANKPPYFILSHETLVAVANSAAHSHGFEAHLPGRFSPRRQSGLLAAIHHASSLPSARWPDYRRSFGHRLSPAERHRAEELRKKRDRHATELGIDPTLIASRATLVDLARDWAEHEKELMKWQLELLRK